MKKLALAILVGLLGFFSLLAFDAWPADKVKFATAVREQPYYYLPALAAEEAEFWKKNGIEGEWVPFRSATTMFYAVSQGTINVGLTATPSVIQGASRGVPIVGILDLGLSAGWSIYVPRESPLRRPEDLKGSKIGIVGYGGAEHAYGRIPVRALGWEKEIKFVAVGGGLPAKTAAMKARIVDGVVASYPTVVGLVASGEIREALSIDEFLPKKWLYYLIYARRDFIGSQRELARRAARALISAMNFVRDNPDWAVAKMRTMNDYPEVMARQLHQKMTYSRDGRIDGEALQNVVNFLTDNGIVAKDKVPALPELYSKELAGS